MASGLDIIGFGSVAVDELLRVDQPLAAGKGRVLETSVAHGGNVATALVAAASLGARAGFVGWLSSDPRDAAVAESLESRGVDISYATRSDAARPIRSTVIVDRNGERFIAFRDDTLSDAPPTFRPAEHADARFLLVDGYAASTPDVVRSAANAGIGVIGDIEWSLGAGTDIVLAACQHLVLPWSFAASYTDKGCVHAMTDALWNDERETVIITRGASGAWLRQRGAATVWHMPCFEVDVVDTTGCGDWFHGAFAAALVRGHDACSGLQFAAAAAALSAESVGGRSSGVSLETVNELLARADAPVPVSVSA